MARAPRLAAGERRAATHLVRYEEVQLGKAAVCSPPRSARTFTGMRPVFGDILIKFGVVRYGIVLVYAKVVCGVLISGSGCGCGPRKRSHSKVRVLPGNARVFAGMPANTRHFADFADFAAKNALRTRFGFREARGTPYHFLISEGRV